MAHGDRDWTPAMLLERDSSAIGDTTQSPVTAWRDTPSPPRRTLGLTIVAGDARDSVLQVVRRRRTRLRDRRRGPGDGSRRATGYYERPDPGLGPLGEGAEAAGVRSSATTRAAAGSPIASFRALRRSTPLWAIPLRSPTRPLVPRRGRDERARLLRSWYARAAAARFRRFGRCSAVGVARNRPDVSITARVTQLALVVDWFPCL